MPEDPPPDPPPGESPGKTPNWPGPGSDDFDPKAHVWDRTRWWTLDRRYWWDGERWQQRSEVAPPGPGPQIPVAQPEVPAEVQRLEPGPGQPGWYPASHVLHLGEWWTRDGYYWWNGTTWADRNAPGAPPAPAPLLTKVRPPGYWRDFWLGFAGVIVVNILILQVGSALNQAAYDGGWSTELNLIPWVVNIGGLILFAVIRPRVAIGMLVAYGVGFSLALLAGIFLLVLCFGGGGGVP